MTDPLVSKQNFEFVVKLVRERTGVMLEPGKEYLVKSRLLPLAHKHDAVSVDALIDRMRAGRLNGLQTEIVEAMVTTETSFFRDIQPFEALKQVILPELIGRRRSQRQLNIWCAACSSGQEPYSMAILLHEYFPDILGWQLNFVATDISHEMLNRSRAGRYSQLEVNRGLPTHLLLKWFRQEGASWQIDDKIRNMVTFSHLNLTQPWKSMPLWDLILLRNVMIYFELELKASILGRVARALRKDGYLLLGGAETTINLDNSFARVQAMASGFYQRKSS